MNITLGSKRKQLGAILIEMGLLSEAELDEALIEQKLRANGERLGALLLRRRMITAQDYIRALARQHQLIAVTR